MDAMVSEPAIMFVGDEAVDMRIVRTVVATTFDVLVGEIEPKIASGHLSTAEDVLGVLLQVREHYAPAA